MTGLSALLIRPIDVVVFVKLADAFKIAVDNSLATIGNQNILHPTILLMSFGVDVAALKQYSEMRSDGHRAVSQLGEQCFHREFAAFLGAERDQKHDLNRNRVPHAWR